MEVFELWVIPDSKKILVTDRPGLPVGATEKHEFDKWFDAVDFANNLCKTRFLNFHVDLDNNAGRYVDWEIENGLI